MRHHTRRLGVLFIFKLILTPKFWFDKNKKKSSAVVQNEYNPMRFQLGKYRKKYAHKSADNIPPPNRIFFTNAVITCQKACCNSNCMVSAMLISYSNSPEFCLIFFAHQTKMLNCTASNEQWAMKTPTTDPSDASDGDSHNAHHRPDTVRTQNIFHVRSTLTTFLRVQFRWLWWRGIAPQAARWL